MFLLSSSVLFGISSSLKLTTPYWNLTRGGCVGKAWNPPPQNPLLFTVICVELYPMSLTCPINKFPQNIVLSYSVVIPVSFFIISLSFVFIFYFIFCFYKKMFHFIFCHVFSRSGMFWNVPEYSKLTYKKPVI